MIKFRGTYRAPFQASTLIDKKAGVIKGLRVIEVGEARGHQMNIDEKTLSALVTLSRGRGVKSRFGHPGISASAMGTLLGEYHNIRFGSDRAHLIGDLHFHKEVAEKAPQGNLFEYVMALAETAPHNAGSSIVAHGERVWIDLDGNEYPEPPQGVELHDYPFFRPTEFKAVDIVDDPAATSAMFEANGFDVNSAFTDESRIAQSFFSQIDELLDWHGIPIEKANEFANRYFSWRGSTFDGNSVPLGTEKIKEIAMQLDKKNDGANLAVEHDEAEMLNAEQTSDGVDETLAESTHAEPEATPENLSEALVAAVLALSDKIDAIMLETADMQKWLLELQQKQAELEIELNAEPTVTNHLSASTPLPKNVEALNALAKLSRSNTVATVKPKHDTAEPAKKQLQVNARDKQFNAVQALKLMGVK